MNDKVRWILDDLLARYPRLSNMSLDLDSAYRLLRDCFANGGKLLICGNGGSAADAGHIAGELLKGFQLKRPLPRDLAVRLEENWGEQGRRYAAALQQGLPVVDLTQNTALMTAFANDVDAGLAFAQQTLALGKPGDALLGISTSGEALNVCHALRIARSLGLSTLCLTGQSGGSMAALCDIALKVPERRTHLVQELHLPVYHALCAMLEEGFFGASET